MAERAHVPERNPVLRLFRRLVRSVSDYRGGSFAVKEAGRWYATPLLMVLVVVEATDIVFAVDSIPAIFAITTDPFIVFTSKTFNASTKSKYLYGSNQRRTRVNRRDRRHAPGDSGDAIFQRLKRNILG
jgi:hypothetical protein